MSFTIGGWDTVGALGIPYSLLGLFDAKDEFYDTKMGSNIAVARHALANDERCEDFRPTLWQPRPGTGLKQVWFAGVHSDVGGAYGPDKQTGACVPDTPLAWMLDEAEQAGVGFERHIRTRLTDSLEVPVNRSRRHIYCFGKPLVRDLSPESTPTRIHSSVMRRYRRNSGYRPPNLKTLLDRDGWDGIVIEP